MKQNSYCTEVGVLPGTNFRLQPKYMDMLNLQEAWQFGRGGGQKVAVIDTGVSPHPRFQHLIPGGDYVMGGDGLSDCDAHGTIVASMIGAAPAGGAAAPPLAPPPRKPVTIPTTEPPPKAPPPQTVTLSPLPQTVTMVPPTETPPPGPFGAPPPAPEAPPAPALPGAPAAPPSPSQQQGAPQNQPAAPAAPLLPPPPPAPGAANHGGGTVTIPSYRGGGQVAKVDNPAIPHPLAPTTPSPAPPAPPPPPPAPPAAPGQAADAYSGIAPDVDIISIRQSSQAFGLKDAYTGDEDPQSAAKITSIDTMAKAIVHAANMGASVINISDVTCMSARNIIDQRSLGAAVRYAAVDKNVVIVAADSSKRDCKQNPTQNPLHPNDPRNWGAVNTVVTPSWFSDYVLTVGAVDADGHPLTQGGQGQGASSIAGPWVGIAAPGNDVIGLSPRDDGLINAIDGPDNSLLVPVGTSFSAAIVSGVAALVRAKYPRLSAYQIINRLTRTARAPARGVDNQVGYGVVDPVAALTWDVPDGPPKPPQQLSIPLNIPKAAPPRDMVPVWVAAGGLTGALLIGGAVFGVSILMKRRKRQ
jgi:membrane-anchored mycosin MYCP